MKISVKSHLLNDYGDNKYYAQFSTKNLNKHYTFVPFIKIKNIKEEFVFEREYNSLGFSDKEWNLNKNNNIRVLCLGDSFTEGDGVSADSSYVSILRNHLKNKFPNIEVMNAGNCGSDPFFNYKVYDDILQYYHPDLVIQEFSYNDFYSDILVRGGFERFVNDSTIQFRKAPKWEKLYAYSYIFRILTHSIGGYNYQLVKENEMPKIINDYKLKTIELFKNYKTLTSKNETELITFTFPVVFQLNNNQNIDFYNEMDSSFSKFGLNFYNLQSCYEDEIKSSHTKPQDYYWKIDGHHNAKGYEMMAKCIEEIITPVIEKRLENQNTLVN